MMRGLAARWLMVGTCVLVLGLTGCPKSDTGTDTEGQTPSEFNEGGDGGGATSRSTALGDLQTIYFDYDRYSIREDSRGALASNATAIKGNTGWGTVTVEGHCDERGSEEYNLALGERRANAVRRYLIDLGVDGGRLRTVSFGEARPAVPGHDENAWRYNRRSEFKGSN